ncbi:MAG: hypothetical protein NUV56_03605 [Candidatus Uhrbacteria bacterium]|nr:hypothetical protein [Candidatus Uhrbacteria bacterium]
MKLLVIDNYYLVPSLIASDIDLWWQDAGGGASSPPEVIIASRWDKAVALFEQHGGEIVGVITDSLLEIEGLSRGADANRSGPGFYWLVRGLSADIPIVIYSMGGLNDTLKEALGLTALPPEAEGNWKFLPKGIDFEDLSWLHAIVEFARRRSPV